MTTKTTDRTTSADLAARLRERAAEYEEAGREKLRAESALLAAMANYERARYRERALGSEWAARLDAHSQAIIGSFAGHLVWYDAPAEVLRPMCDPAADFNTFRVDAPTHQATCPACLAALDEVAP
jgi:hypothetical protein